MIYTILALLFAITHLHGSTTLLLPTVKHVSPPILIFLSVSFEQLKQAFECREVTKGDVLKIEDLDQWCLQKLSGIKWCYHVQNDDVKWTTKQPHLSAIVQAWHFSLYGHILQMPDETAVKKILSASSTENWRRPPRQPRTTWMKTIQQDLKSSTR